MLITTTCVCAPIGFFVCHEGIIHGMTTSRQKTHNENMKKRHNQYRRRCRLKMESRVHYTVDI